MSSWYYIGGRKPSGWCHGPRARECVSVSTHSTGDSLRWLERLHGMPEVTGSRPLFSTFSLR